MLAEEREENQRLNQKILDLEEIVMIQSETIEEFRRKLRDQAKMVDEEIFKVKPKVKEIHKEKVTEKIEGDLGEVTQKLKLLKNHVNFLIISI